MRYATTIGALIFCIMHSGAYAITATTSTCVNGLDSVTGQTCNSTTMQNDTTRNPSANSMRHDNINATPTDTYRTGVPTGTSNTTVNTPTTSTGTTSGTNSVTTTAVPSNTSGTTTTTTGTSTTTNSGY